ncbi:hypothetical protein SLA2020_504560 [Shorea laevis]
MQTMDGLGDAEDEEDDVESCIGEINGKLQRQESQEGDRTIETVPDSIENFEIPKDGENRARAEKWAQMSGISVFVVGTGNVSQNQVGLAVQKNRRPSKGVENTRKDPNGDPYSEAAKYLGQAQETMEEIKPRNNERKIKAGNVMEASGHSNAEKEDCFREDLMRDERNMADGRQS